MSGVARRIVRARRALIASTLARAFLRAALVALVVLGAGLAADTLTGLPLAVRRLLVPLALVAGIAALLRDVMGPVRAAICASNESVALWFEARLPSLRYALVTSVDARHAGSVPALDRAVSEAPLEREVATASRSALVRPAIAVGVLALLLVLIPGGAVGRVAAPRDGDALDRAGASSRAATDPLATIVVRVTPPAYSGLAATSHDDPSTVAALVGSSVRIEGRGTGVLVRAVARDTDSSRTAGRPAVNDGDSWSVTIPVPERAAAIRLAGPARDRVLIIDPIADSVPTARLDSPVRDSVLRAAVGQVTLSAEVRDDLGLAEASFEFIVSTGAGETFTFRSGRVGARRFAAGARTATLGARLALDTLKLAPGDLIHLRAVAVDRNNVSGPGRGASETRTLRIARPDEYDSVSVDPMPPTDPEKSALSQRMILMMTEELVARMQKPPRFGRAELQRDARRIAVEQTRLRKRVGEVVFLRLGENEGEHAHAEGDGHQHAQAGDETPVVAINEPLLEAYNHMWRATTELETADPAAAIPWMQRAIEALNRARAAERIYLRGRPPRVVVDIDKVRGTGKESGSSSVREPRAPADAERAARLARFDVALGIVANDPSAAADSLLLIRLTVPEEERATAQALDAAAAMVREGGDLTDALSRARRALFFAGRPVRRTTVGPWGG